MSNIIKEDIKSNIKNSDKDQIQKFAQLVSDYKYSLYGEKIIKKGNKWQVTDHTGKKNLGTYDTKKDAEERLKQVEMFKHMNEYTKKDFIEDVNDIEKEAVNQYHADTDPLRKSAAEGKVVACEDIKELADNLPNTESINIDDDILNENESDGSYFGVTAADGGLIIGTVSNDIDMVRKIRKSLADKYKEIFRIKRITNKEELIFNLTESYRLDEEDGANFSGSFSAQAPEHLKKVTDPSGELLTTDPEGTSHIKESIPWPSLNKDNLTPAQLEQIKSPEFKAWFGDWEKGEGSKVVDYNGYPMVVFHGTQDSFDSFDEKDTIFFTDDLSTARLFSDKDTSRKKGSILECFLNIRNPYEIDADYNDYDEVPFEGEIMYIDDIIKKLEKRGDLDNHDGIIIKNIREGVMVDWANDYIPFSPSQIKSAKENKGNFSTDSDNINERFIKEYKKLTESILDVPQKNYYEGVIKNDKMTPECRKQIIDTIKKWKEQINFDFGVYKIWAKGSLLTKRYNDTTDLDISIYTDMSKEQLEEIYDIVPKGKNIMVDERETSHPLDFYVLTKGEHTPLENLDCIYDVAHNKWIKRDDDYENDIPLEYVIQVANFFVNGCVVALNNYENDKILYNYYRNLDPDKQEIDKDERKSKISAQKDKLKADLDGMRVALRMISNFRQDAYNGEDSNPVLLTIQTEITNPHVTFNEQLAKILEKFEIRQKLRDCVKECQNLIGIEETTGLEESLENKNKDKTAAFCFGRFGIPQYGYILLWKYLSYIENADHLIYTSHSYDKKKNPISYDTKSAVIKYLIKDYNIDATFVDSDSKTIIDVAVDLYKKGYNNIIFVGGSDRVESIVSLLKKYNGVPNKEGNAYIFNSIEGLSAGDRDPDNDTDVSGMSGTKMRKFILDGDFEKFKKNCPIKDKFILKSIYDEAKSFMES